MSKKLASPKTSPRVIDQMPNEHDRKAFGIMAAYKINRGKLALSQSPHSGNQLTTGPAS